MMNDPADANMDKVARKPRGRKPRHTYMLHDPKTFENLGKYRSTDFRYSALKVASRGCKDIVLRRTNTKVCYQYEGSVVNLDKPQTVMRGEREITYSKKPTVKFIRKFVCEIPKDIDDGDEDNADDATPVV